MVLMLALSNIVGQGVKMIQLLVDTWAMRKNESEDLKQFPICRLTVVFSW